MSPRVRVGQAFDQYTTRSIQQNASTLAENEAKAQALSNLENIFNEAKGQGLNQAMAGFWNAWQDLANNPRRDYGTFRFVG